MATALNSVTFPIEPAGCQVSEKPSGSRIEMADGSLDYRPASSTGVRRMWTVQVDACTATNVATLRTPYLAAILANVTWAPPAGGSYTVRAVAGSWSEAPDVQGGALLSTVRFQLEEAS